MSGLIDRLCCAADNEQKNYGVETARLLRDAAAYICTLEETSRVLAAECRAWRRQYSRIRESGGAIMRDTGSKWPIIKAMNATDASAAAGMVGDNQDGGHP